MRFVLALPLLAGAAAAAELPALVVKPQTIDKAIQIGYGLAIADVDGDKKDDIVLADAKQIVWYRNPTWEKFVIAENLTARDHVCVAARDVDGDGKAEIAVGAEWNPNDTVNSGAIFLLEAPADRTQKWGAKRLPHEPTTHRMGWVRSPDRGFFLAVQPLHGRGNK
ncbi:MAG TPA: FG-GAP and VCBS repeat-containing protein, partial [Opitutaceae bacterium]